MTDPSNPFMTAAFEMQKQWSEALANLTQEVPIEPPDLGKMGATTAAKAWSEGLKQAIGNGVSASAAAAEGLPELLSQMKAAASSYATLVDAWTNSVSGSTPEPLMPKQTNGNHGEQMQWLWGFLNPETQFVPFKIPGTNGTPKPENWQRAMGTMAGNWAKFVSSVSESTGIKLESKETTQNTVGHFYNSWLKAYESTVGRFVNLPLVGPHRYEQEKVNKSIDAYMKYQAAVVDFHSKMLKTGFETLQEVIDESSKLVSEKEITDEVLDEIYHLLMNVGERRYHQLFSSPLFCQSLESLNSTGLEFRRAWHEMTEESLKSTPIVTQTQADEMHKEIYLLKKRVSELEGILANTQLKE